MKCETQNPQQMYKQGEHEYSEERGDEGDMKIGRRVTFPHCWWWRWRRWR